MFNLRFLRFLVPLLLAASPGFSDSWSLGAAGGFGVYHDANILNAGASATAGFGARFAVGAVLDQDVGQHFGGELRYTYCDGDSELKSGGLR